MNERGRYLILSDATSETDIVIWNFHVKNFSGVEEQTISINSINNAGLCQLQLISDKSDAYNEKLTVSNLVITVIAIK
jgi:hypothetical protein